MHIGGAVALLAPRVRAVDLRQHRVVDVRAERILDRARYGLWPSVVSCTRPRRRLATSCMNSYAEPASRVADEPGRDQLRVGVDAPSTSTPSRRRLAPACRPGRSCPSRRRTTKSHRTGGACRAGCAASRPGSAVHAAPSSTSSLATVFFATPVMRTVARMRQPSTSAATTATRFAMLNLFILTIMLDRTMMSTRNHMSWR